MSGISGHLVRRGAQMAQVHFTKVTTESTPEHGSAPAMEIDPMDYLPAVVVAIVTALLIASVSSRFRIATSTRAHTDKPYRSAIQWVKLSQVSR